jgi:hypothetical protein
MVRQPESDNREGSRKDARPHGKRFSLAPLGPVSFIYVCLHFFRESNCSVVKAGAQAAEIRPEWTEKWRKNAVKPDFLRILGKPQHLGNVGFWRNSRP